MLKEAQEAHAVLLFFLQSDMSINFDEPAQFLGAHLGIIFLRAPVRALDAVHGHAATAQDTLYFNEDGVLLFKTDVTQHVEADDIIEAGAGKREMREFRRQREVVTIAPRRQHTLRRNIDARKRYALAL